MGTIVFSVILLVLLVAGIIAAIKGVKTAPITEDRYGNKTEAYDTKGLNIAVRAIGAGVAVLMLIILMSMSVKSVDPTDVGVPITLGQPGTPLDPGPHLLLPWTTVSAMDVKTQVLTMDDDNEVKTITVDRVQTPVDVVVYFHVDKAKAPTLLLTVGEDYVDKIVKPLTRSVVYDKGSIYSAENIQNQRDNYETSIQEALVGPLAARGIILEKVELKKIQLPDAILANAQAKINAEEQQKQTIINAKTKVIEAEAQAKANTILADSIKQNKDVCQLLLVQAMSQGKIQGPLYINPCGTDSGSAPLLTKPVG
jgi:regulator of protease activity HflC (stomatin/prohibitin superfamily)